MSCLSSDSLATFKTLSSTYPKAARGAFMGPTAPSTLAFAAACNAVQIVQHLLATVEAGASATKLAEAALLATAANALPTLKLLLDRGADVAHCTPAGDTLLHVAAAAGSLPVFSYLMALPSAVMLGSLNAVGMTPLHTAIAHCRTSVVQAILASSPTHAAKATKDGLTPLHLLGMYCSGEKSVTIAQLLLLACPAAALSQTNRLRIGPAHVAAARSNAQLLGLLLRSGSPPNSKDACGRTVLHIAAFHDDLTCAIVAVQEGCDVTVMDDVGKLALHVAVESDSDSMVGYLVSNSPSTVDSVSESGSVIHTAVTKSAVRCLPLLFRAGVEITDESAEALCRSADGIMASSYFDPAVDTEAATEVVKLLKRTLSGLTTQGSDVIMEADVKGAYAVVDHFRDLGVGNDSIAMNILGFCGRGHFEESVQEDDLSFFLAIGSKRKGGSGTPTVSSSSSSASSSDNEDHEFDAPPPVKKRVKTSPIGMLEAKAQPWVSTGGVRGARVSCDTSFTV
jgi:ankyrin repeat protein